MLPGRGLDGLAGLIPGLAGGGLPGTGGVSRGPGPAALTGSGNTDPEFGTFKDKTFRGNMGEPEVPLGFAFTPPDEVTMEEEAIFDRPGEAKTFKKGNERITWHSRLLPRHNDVLKKYFKEEKRSPKE